MKHWWWQRVSALGLLASLILSIQVTSEAWLFVALFMVIHAHQGVGSILMDYVHTSEVRTLVTRLIRYCLMLALILWAGYTGWTLPNLHDVLALVHL